MTKLDNLEIAHLEHEAWLRLVDHLKSVGAVSEADCRSTPSQRDTPGLQLFHFIRLWGHRYADLREAEAACNSRAGRKESQT